MDGIPSPGGRVTVCLNEAAQAFERGELLHHESIAHHKAVGAAAVAELAARDKETAGQDRARADFLSQRQQRIAASQGVLATTAEAKQHYHSVMHDVAKRVTNRASEDLHDTSKKYREAELVLAAAQINLDAAEVAQESADRENQILATNASLSQKQASNLQREARTVEVMRNEQRAAAVAAHGRAAYLSATERINTSLAAQAGENAAAALVKSETKAHAHSQSEKRRAAAEQALADAIAKQREARALEVAAAAELATLTRAAEQQREEAQVADVEAVAAERASREKKIAHQIAQETNATAMQEARAAEAAKSDAETQLTEAEKSLADALHRSTGDALELQLAEEELRVKREEEVAARNGALEASANARNAARLLLQCEQSFASATAREAAAKRHKDMAVVEATIQQKRHTDESFALASARVMESTVGNEATRIGVVAQEAAWEASVCASVAADASLTRALHDSIPARAPNMTAVDVPVLSNEVSAHLAAASARRIAELAPRV